MILNIEPDKYYCYGIYLIRNIKNDNCYIGQTSESFYKRFLRHNNMLENGNHFNRHLQRAYKKYGSDAFVFSIVEICEDLSKLDSLEEVYIRKYRERFVCYNVLSGGTTACGANNPFYGKTHSKETLAIISEKSKGRSVGEQNYFWGKDHSGENNGFYGHHHTDESRRKMSIAKSKMYKGSNNPFFGKTHTPEVIEKIRKRTMEATHREVVCIETGIKYRSIAEAERQTNISAKRISAVCAGHGLTAGKLHWKYFSESQEDTG